MFVRKSIKIGKNIHVNVTKNGLSSITYGGKHARLGLRKDGSTYASANKDGIYVRQELTGKAKASKKQNINTTKKHGIIFRTTAKLFSMVGDILLLGLNKINKNNKMVQNHTQEEIQGFYQEHYTKHLKYIFSGIVLLIIGIFIPPILIGSMILLIIGIGCMIKNWKRINEEWKTRISK